MKENIFEIISQLVKRLLYEGEEIEDSEKLINSLKEDGYNIDEINQAFEFIFDSEDKKEIETEAARIDLTNNGVKQRIFNIKEKINFDLEVQGVLIQLGALDVIKEEELEELITKLLMRYRASAGISEVWNVLDEIVDDELKLISISKQITQFKNVSQVSTTHLH